MAWGYENNVLQSQTAYTDYMTGKRISAVEKCQYKHNCSPCAGEECPLYPIKKEVD
jgi:hypothetical protein